MTTPASIRSYVEKQVLPKHQDVDEEDAVTLLTLLLETQLLDPSIIGNCATASPTNPPVKRARKWDLKLDENVYFDCKGPTRTKGSVRKRITYLRLGGWRRFAFEFHEERIFVLLSKLECLESLCAVHCKSFQFTSTIARLPKLKSVTCLTHNGTAIGSLDFLQEMGESNLEILELECLCIQNEEELATFVFDILPFFPKLRKVNVGWNKIDTLQGIAERIRNNNDDAEKAKNSRLRCLNLGHYEGKEKSKLKSGTKDRKEIEAMKTILLAFRELSVITGLWITNVSSRRLHLDLDAGISYQMEINFTGRILVESNGDQGIIAARPSSIHSPIPLSVWPNVLARTWKKRGSVPFYERRKLLKLLNADGIFYLLRNVRALQEGNNRSHSRGNGGSNSGTSS